MAETKKPITNEYPDEEGGKKQLVTVVTPENFPIYYADAVRTAISLYDLKLTFAVTTATADGNNIMTELATIILSPLHAKRLLESLEKNVRQYENEVMPLETKRKALKLSPE